MKTWTGKDRSSSDFSIETIRVHFERGVTALNPVGASLFVSLEPMTQDRERGFGGSSFEKKKYPATLQIELYELKKMMDAITGDLLACYKVLMDYNLSDALEAEKENQKATRARGE